MYFEQIKELLHAFWISDGQEQDIRAMIHRDDENSTNVITLNILPPRVGKCGVVLKISKFK